MDGTGQDTRKPPRRRDDRIILHFVLALLPTRLEGAAIVLTPTSRTSIASTPRHV